MRRITATAAALAGLVLFSFAQEPKNGGARDEVDPDEAKTVWEYLAKRYDANGDGKITRDEYTRGDEQFARLDKDENGLIEEADSKQRTRGRRGRGNRKRVEPPQEGAIAPNFELQSLYPKPKPKPAAKSTKGDAKAKKEAGAETYDVVELSSLKGKKPVALIFGSYT